MRRLLLLISALVGASPARGGVTASDLSLGEYYHLGAYYLQVGRREDAISNYREMIALHPDSREAERGWLIIGDAYLELGRQAAAGQEKTLTRSKDFFAKAAEAYRTALGRFPAAEAEARLRLGKLYAFHVPGSEETGRGWLRSVTADFPEKAGQAALSLGETYLAEGRTEEAFSAFQDALDAFPEVAAAAALAQGKILEGTGDHLGALAVYSLVIRAQALDGYFNAGEFRGTTLEEALSGLAGAALEAQDPGKASDLIAQIAADYPGTNAEMTARFGNVEFLARRGETEKAGGILDGIAFRSPRSLYAPKALFRKARLLAGEERREAYREIRRRWPKSISWVQATRSLASDYLRKIPGQTEAEAADAGKKAELLLKELINRYPASPEAAAARLDLAAISD